MPKRRTSHGLDIASGLSGGTLKLILDALAKVNRARDTADFYAELIAFFKQWISFESATLFEFRKGLQPRLLYAWGPNSDLDMAQYLDGLYLLDPFYDLYEVQGRTGVFRLNSDSWDAFGMTESYKRYWHQVGGGDEVAGLFPIAPRHCVHLSLMLKGENGEDVRAAALLEVLEETITTYFAMRFESGRKLEDASGPSRRKIHETISLSLQSFGAELLTVREREVVQLLLKGHSAKSIARILGISPGTAGIHRSHVYQKLGVAGQGELFSAFITGLTRA